MMQMTGHMETEVFPVSTTNFFARDSTAYVAFDPPSDGSAPALLLYMGGRIQRAVRMP
jgi:hypothetical protein